VYESRAYLDEFADTDGPVQMKVPDGRGNAVAGTPLRSGGISRLVDPFEQCACIDDAVVTDVDSADAEVVDCFVAANLWRYARV
jgi:hypothetical protein